MVSLKKLALGAAMAIGTLAVSAVPANAAVRVFVGGPAVSVGYVPACPGPGYSWVAGYYSGGYWVPGRWNFVGARGPVFGDRFYHRDFDHRFERDRFYHERFRR